MTSFTRTYYQMAAVLPGIACFGHWPITTQKKVLNLIVQQLGVKIVPFMIKE